MPVIKSSVTINAPFERVWEVATRVEEFPDFIEDLKSLTVLERSDDGRKTITEWVGVVKEFGMTIKWTEEDIWDPETRTCAFRMVKGDLDKYEGTWTFIPNGDTVAFNSVIEFEHNVPLIGPMIKNLITAKLQESTDKILAAIKKKSEEGS